MWKHTINKLHAGSNVKSQYAQSLIVFTHHGKGHVRAVSIHCWQALFRSNKQTCVTDHFDKFLRFGLGLGWEHQTYELHTLIMSGAPENVSIHKKIANKNIHQYKLFFPLHKLCIYIRIQIEFARLTCPDVNASLIPLILNRTLRFLWYPFRPW